MISSFKAKAKKAGRGREFLCSPTGRGGVHSHREKKNHSLVLFPESVGRKESLGTN